MDFVEVIEQARALLRSKGRMTYRTLKRQFALDDEALADLKDELIEAERVAVDENGKVLVWTGSDTREETASQPPLSRQSDPSSPALTPQPGREAPAGERRQLTVMFCDLVGSTALSEQLDPEDLHAIVRTYQDACRQVVERYDGHIAQYLGDGILVYFGYPAAHEDDAVRGVRAGLEIISALQRLSSPFQSPDSPHPRPLPGRRPLPKGARELKARIGIHTGPVVIGAIGGGEHTEQLALGETPNIAARVQGKAEPNTVAISADTYRLVQGFFACEDLGLQDLKGLSAPLTLYQVTGEGEAQNRFDVSIQQGLTPLVGREEEVELLLRRWERAKAGQGQVVLLSGEAGIGKSRLVQVLRDHSRNELHLSILCRCSPFYQNSALYPIIDRMQQVLEFTKADSAETKLTKLTQSLEPVDMTDEETVALFAALLSIPLAEDHPPLQYSPQKQKEKTLQALVTWLHKTAEQQIVRLEIEDLHWADPSTLELLGLLVDQAPTSRMLILLTFRPEFTPPWPAQAHTLQMYLNRLPQQEITAMVERVAGKALPDEVVQQLLTKSDGVPLYIEEMTKNLLESGLLTERDGCYELTGPLPDMAIPSSLQDSFAARLDRLAPVRELAQIGAVLGREFSYELIRAVSQMQDPKLHDGLGQLSAADILFQRGVPPAAAYTFKHALLQDAAYQSLLKSQRQRFHARTAQVLEQQFPETKDLHPELLAHHYTEASLAEQAIPYWRQAGQRAMERSANEEAIQHLTAALAPLRTDLAQPEQVQTELQLQTMLGTAYMVNKGWGIPEVKQAFSRAHELSQCIPETSQLFPTLYGLTAYYGTRAEFQTALPLAQQGLRLAERVQDDGFLLMAGYMNGAYALHQGEFIRARELNEDVVQRYGLSRHGALGFQFGLDPGLVCRVYAAYSAWYLGYSDQARAWAEEALALAPNHPHLGSQTVSVALLSNIYLQRGETTRAIALAEQAIAEAPETEPVFSLQWAKMFGGATLAKQGRSEEGLILWEQGWQGYQATGSRVFNSVYLRLKVDMHVRLGRTTEGLAILAEAQAFVEETGERVEEAELYRLKGELLLQQSPDKYPEAEACYQKSLKVARHQEAKSLELRAATSLARLWQQQGKTAEAREVLAPVYTWFTEGFDTADLKDAKALLAELS